MLEKSTFGERVQLLLIWTTSLFVSIGLLTALVLVQWVQVFALAAATITALILFIFRALPRLMIERRIGSASRGELLRWRNFYIAVLDSYDARIPRLRGIPRYVVSVQRVWRKAEFAWLVRELRGRSHRGESP